MLSQIGLNLCIIHCLTCSTEPQKSLKPLISIPYLIFDHQFSSTRIVYWIYFREIGLIFQKKVKTV